MNTQATTNEFRPELADEYERMFYETLRIRIVEEKIADIYSSDKIQSPVHLSIGQEHISVGVSAALRPHDMTFGTYRSHALYLSRGGSMNAFMAELYGKRTGCGGGKAGSMHLSAPEVGFMGSSAVVASTIPHGVGAALAAKLQKKDQVIVVFFGEGAAGEGVYHESLNFAASHKLPVLFVCENNDMSIFTISSDMHNFEIVPHAQSYGIDAAHEPEGMDLNVIRKTAGDRIDAIRRGEGPKLIEYRTYRYRQHVGPGDDHKDGHRPMADLEAWMAKDPVVQDRERIEKYRPFIEREIEAAMQYAEESAFPDAGDLLKDVY